MWQWQTVVVVPTSVAVPGDGAHVCGSGKRWWWCHVCGSGKWWWWCPRVMQWQAVVVVPTLCGSGRRCGGDGAHVCGTGR